jgi:hypothetical protein
MWMCTGLTSPDPSVYLIRFDAETLLLEVYSKGGKLEYHLVLEPQQPHKDLRGFAAKVEDSSETYAVTFFQNTKTKQVYYAIALVGQNDTVALWECK